MKRKTSLLQLFAMIFLKTNIKVQFFVLSQIALPEAYEQCTSYKILPVSINAFGR